MEKAGRRRAIADGGASASRTLAWSACLNTRDLGGLRTAAGWTRHGVVVRSDNLFQLDAAGRDALIAYGVTTVVDLRADEELDQFPSPFAGDTYGVAYRNVAFRLDDPRQFGDEPIPAFVDAHAGLLEWCRRSVGQAVTTVARCEGTAVIHCHMGKDRTGVLSGLLLALAGVADGEIAADYAASDDGLASMYRMYLDATPSDEERARVSRLLVCAPEWMLTLLAQVRRRWGGPRDYLLSAGVDAGDIDLLMRRFVGPTADREQPAVRARRRARGPQPPRFRH